MLMAGKEAHVFKYADRPTLFFDCQISISIREPGEQCQVGRIVINGDDDDDDDDDEDDDDEDGDHTVTKFSAKHVLLCPEEAKDLQVPGIQTSKLREYRQMSLEKAANLHIIPTTTKSA